MNCTPAMSSLAIERAEKDAGTGIESVWVGCAGAGLASRISRVEIPINGRRIEEEDVDHLLVTARDTLQPDGRMVLHAQPAHYSVDGPHGVANPVGLYAEQLGVDVHVLLADGAPIRNIITAVQSAHLTVEGVVAAPIASAHASLTPEEREEARRLRMVIFEEMGKVPVEVRDIDSDVVAREQLQAATGRTTVPCLRIESEGSAVTWMHESRDIIGYLREVAVA